MRKRPSKFQLIWKVFTIKKDSGMICGVLFFKNASSEGLTSSIYCDLFVHQLTEFFKYRMYMISRLV